MRTILKTNSGFWEANSNKVNREIPEGKMRLATLRIEVLELDCANEVDLQTQFTICAALADESPEHKRLLLSLRDHLNQNFPR